MKKGLERIIDEIGIPGFYEDILCLTDLCEPNVDKKVNALNALKKELINFKKSLETKEVSYEEIFQTLKLILIKYEDIISKEQYVIRMANLVDAWIKRKNGDKSAKIFDVYGNEITNIEKITQIVLLNPHKKYNNLQDYYNAILKMARGFDDVCVFGVNIYKAQITFSKEICGDAKFLQDRKKQFKEVLERNRKKNLFRKIM